MPDECLRKECVIYGHRIQGENWYCPPCKLCARAKTRLSKIDALKEIIRAWGLNPEEILTREALTQPHRTIIGQNQYEQAQLNHLTKALKEQMLKEMREKV